ncbi:MAG: hypothetical protein IT580_02790 [Verrucomicrobiales bacterium]|nr:hypothetical protein [Verrucomicrobiales bacterium]
MTSGIVRRWCGAALVALGASLSAVAATLPPGATPCLTGATPQGYGTLLLLQSASYLQQGPAAPAEATSPAPTAVIQLESPSAYGVSNALVTGPAGSFQAALTRTTSSTATWEQTYASDAALQAAFRRGSWSSSFHLIFPDGESFVGFVPFTLGTALAPVPAIANLAAAQSIPAASPFTLSWTPWVGSSTNDRISLHVVDANGTSVFSAATDCSGTTLLAAGATSATVPAGRLQAGRSYTGYLTFGAALVAENDANSLLTLRGEQARTTRFTLAATSGGGGGTEGTITQPSVGGTNFVFTLTGTPGTVYAIESTADLVTWTRDSEVTLPATGTLQVQIPLPPGGTSRFYRALSLGGGGGEEPGPANLAVSLTGPRTLSLRVTGTTGATYAIEQSQNYTNWAAITNVTLAAGATSAVVSVTVPEGVAFLVLRAVGTGSVTPEPGASPTLAVALSGSTLTLSVTGADANKTYSIQQVGSAWGAWTASGKSVTTDSSGKGSVTVDVAAPAVGSPTAGFYRAVLP